MPYCSNNVVEETRIDVEEAWDGGEYISSGNRDDQFLSCCCHLVMC